MQFNPPWRDPQTDPPEEYSEVIITTETGRVTSCKYYKGKFSTYTPILAWQPLPEPAKPKKEKEEAAEKKTEVVEPVKESPAKRAVKKKTKK